MVSKGEYLHKNKNFIAYLVKVIKGDENIGTLIFRWRVGVQNARGGL